MWQPGTGFQLSSLVLKLTQILDFFEIFQDLQYSDVNTVVRFSTVRY